METVQRIIQAPIETIRSTIMATNDISFAAVVAHHFNSFQQDRQMDSKQTIYATRSAK